MKITVGIGALCAALISASTAMAEKLSLADISQYLNALRTTQGEFTQINADGTFDKGKIYIKRPGRMRFEYAPPNGALVVAGGSSVVVFDPKSNQRADTYPLKQTPLSLILARNIDLERARMVVGHDFDGIATVVTAQDPDNPEYGSIEMKFTTNPTELRQWVVRDSGGTETTVILGAMTRGGQLPNRLFDPDAVKESDR